LPSKKGHGRTATTHTQTHRGRCLTNDQCPHCPRIGYIGSRRSVAVLTLIANFILMPQILPEFYQYLLDYPRAKPANVVDSFYWSHVKFGLKPTLRVVQVSTLRGGAADPIAYAIAEKQLYSSHYFQTSLDLTFCVRDTRTPNRFGFYLIKVLGSEQAGLTGVKGSIVRKVAVGRSVSSLQKSLEVIKGLLEQAR
jgi:hypothetical protein